MILLSSFSVPSCSAAGAVQEGCFPQTLLTRKGQLKCWVQFDLGSDQRFCVSRHAWKQWLERSQASRCGKGEGRWSLSSPLVNDASASKKILRKFTAESWVSDSKAASLMDTFLFGVEKLRDRLSDGIGQSDPFGILKRLLLDQRQLESPEGILRKLGFVHLVSAAGIHLYALAQVIYFLVGTMAVRWRAPLRKGKAIAIFVSGFFWIFAWMLEGFRGGMLRPWIVILLRALARTLGFRWRFFSPLAVSLLADIAVGWWRQDLGRSAGWGMGRLHYALAVGGGLLAVEWVPQGKASFRRHVYEHACLAIGSWLPTAFLDTYETGLVAFATPLLSLLTIPVFTLIIYPLSLFASFALPFLEESQEVLRFLGILTTEGIFFLTSICLKTPTLWVVSKMDFLFGLILATAFLIGTQRRLFQKWIYLCLMILCVRGLVSFFTPKQLNVHQIEQLDVGQGDGTLIQASIPFQRNWVGMLDVGSERGLRAEQWLSLLSQRGITEIQSIGLTHLDEDHSGALQNLASVIPIQNVWVSQKELKTKRGARFQKKLLEVGLVLEPWNPRKFPFPVIEVQERFKKQNAFMSAVFLPLRKGFYLNMGDASQDLERQVLQWLQKNHKLDRSQKVRILKVSHHGSRYSTSPDLLFQLSPSLAWISCGLNRYGHPTPEVLTLLTSKNIPFQRTDQQGVLRYQEIGEYFRWALFNAL